MSNLVCHQLQHANDMELQNPTCGNISESLYFRTMILFLARYRRERGRIAERTPRCVVAKRVAFALACPIPNRSANLSAVILTCLSCETYAWRGCTRSVAASEIEYLICIDLIKHSLRHVRDGDIEDKTMLSIE